MKFFNFYFILFIFKIFKLVSLLPTIPCPEIFRYDSDGDKYYSRLYIPNISKNLNELTILEAEFIQRESVIKNVHCGIEFRENNRSMLAKIANGQPVSFFAHFPDVNIVPTLRSIKINRFNTICSIPDKDIVGDNLISMVKMFTHTTDGMIEINDIFNFGNKRGQGCTVSNRTEVKPTTEEIISVEQKIETNIETTIKPNIEPTTVTLKRTPLEVKVENIPASTCGIEIVKNLPKKFSEMKLSRGHFPWLVGIFNKQRYGKEFICCGSLVSERAVISAAHCFTVTGLTANHTLIELGRYDLDDFEEDGYVMRQVREIFIHPDFRVKGSFEADIAVVQFNRNVKFTSYIQPICLWNNRMNIDNMSNGYVAGWGDDTNHFGLSSIPKLINATITDDMDCMTSSASFNITISSNIFCAGNKQGSGPCSGDAGSGLMFYSGDHWVLRGIVSAALSRRQLCSMAESVIYCDVAKYLPWIESKLV